MQTGEIRCAVPAGDDCGEAATWCPAENCLYWTDVNRFLVHRLNVTSGAVHSWLFDEPCVALALTNRPGTLLVALASQILEWQPASDTRAAHGFCLQTYPTARLNDGRAGPGGEFWIGSMANNVGDDGLAGDVVGEHGELFRLACDAPMQVFQSGIGISNTVCFSPDQRHFYFGDTPRNMIWRYDYDAGNREIGNRTEFFSGFQRGVPDGSTIDGDGYLWNCRFGGGCVVRVAPDGGVDRVIEMPVSNITTCEFGGADLQTLYITTARILLQRHERLAGGLFAMDMDVQGLAPLHVNLD